MADHPADAAPPPSKPDDYSPGAIHMLRTVQTNTLQLAQMADQKASILMGASFLVFSIAVSRGAGGETPWSLGMLAVFAFLSAMCGAVAVMPSLARPGAGGRTNPLFFGHFYSQEEDVWTRNVLAALHADETVFRLMLRDIYQNGQVLRRRKYRYLGYAYRLFIVGLLATAAVFLLELTLI